MKGIALKKGITLRNISHNDSPLSQKEVADISSEAIRRGNAIAFALRDAALCYGSPRLITTHWLSRMIT